MKTLLITNYWTPYNSSGTFRWLMLNKYLDFDILTSKKPKKGFYDETLPKSNGRTYRHGSSLYAILSGLYLSIISWFIKADVYVYTIPPESLLFGAWVQEKILRRKVIIDLRDKIGRKYMPLRILAPIWNLLYKSMRTKVTTMRYFDKDAILIRHGYMVEELFGEMLIDSYLGCKRYDFETWIRLVRLGAGIEYTDPIKHYTSSSILTFRHLGSNIKGGENLHPELFSFEPESWKAIAKKWKIVLNAKYNGKLK